MSDRIDIALAEAMTDPANHPYGARMPNWGNWRASWLLPVVRQAQAEALRDAADNLSAYPEIQATLRARADHIETDTTKETS